MNRKDNDSILTMHPHVSQNKYIDSHSQIVTNVPPKEAQRTYARICKALVPNIFPHDIQ